MKKITKVLTLVLFVASLAAMTSCKKTDQQLIVGKWKCTAARITEFGNVTPYTPAVGMIWEFKSDGTLTLDRLDPEIDIDNKNCTYVISGNHLHVSFVDFEGDKEQETFIVNTLSKSALTITEKEDEIDDDILTLEFSKL